MPSGGATRVAEQILDDLNGAAYYADPEILAGILKHDLAAPEEAEAVARKVCTELLRHYARTALTRGDRNSELSFLTGLLEQHGVR